MQTATDGYMPAVRRYHRAPMLPRHDEPIVAIATAPGRGAVGIVRLSGRNLRDVVHALCRRELQPRHATYLAFTDAQGQPIDQGLALYFPAPHSYTGEEVLELQAHGGPAVLELLLQACLVSGAAIGLRPARPGEFTERAFLNGKLDLAQAEAVADLIDASSAAAVRSAGRSLAGVFSQQVQGLAERALSLRVLVEATLDFPEEEIDFLQQADALGRLKALADELVHLQQRAHQGARLREGLRVVLAGQPNVGKSSLLNALAGAELAIVTPIAGTTRDRIAEVVHIDGVPLHITDTAGLRQQHEALDEVERIGMQRSRQAMAGSDVVVFLHDLQRMGEAAYDVAEGLIEDEIASLQAQGATVLHVYNKADLPAAPLPPAQAGKPALPISAHTGAGLPALRQALLQAAGLHAGTEGLFMARSRHLQALQHALVHLQAAQAHLESRQPALDLMAEELRLAHQALGTITGGVGVEELLGAIFSSFCIGK